MTLLEGLTLAVVFLQTALIGGQLYVYSQQRKLMANQLKVSTADAERARTHDRLSVRPRLDFKAYVNTGKLAITLTNHGLGVAFVKRMDFFAGGVAIEGDYQLDRAQKIGPALGIHPEQLLAPSGGVNLLTPTSAIGPDSQVVIVDFDVASTVNTIESLRRVKIVLHYESINGDQDTATLDGAVA